MRQPSRLSVNEVALRILFERSRGRNGRTRRGMRRRGGGLRLLMLASLFVYWPVSLATNKEKGIDQEVTKDQHLAYHLEQVYATGTF